MKILVIHCHYQHRGGEDSVCEAEIQLLREAGHEVIVHVRDNKGIPNSGAFQKLALASRTIWSGNAHEEIRDVIARSSPDVAHFHNTFPLISPSAYYACAEAGVPVVQSLHNYRLLCPAAAFLRDGRVCEECLGRAVPWPGVLHGCYRDSRPATLALATMLSVHRALGTWRNKVNLYIALSEFARKKFIEGGLPAERIMVKSNFVSDRPARPGCRGDYGLWVGRFSEEKGIRVLLTALGELSLPVPFKLAGTGPLFEEVARGITQNELEQVDLLGRVPPPNIFDLMHGARFVVVPSVCFENFPVVIAEAFACGVPVVASRIGSMVELVEDGRTGLHFKMGDPADLAAKVEWAWTHPAEMKEMGQAARREYEAKYTAQHNYDVLMRIYETARTKAV
jgi:glycosyltransferase involved in cell wall biosynthesis